MKNFTKLKLLIAIIWLYSGNLIAQCPIDDCGGPICDIVINSVPTETCDEATIVVADIGGTAVDPAYDTDVYLYQSDGTLIGDIGNLYTTGGISLTWTPEVVGCDVAVLDYQVEIVCWPTAAPGLGGGIYSIPFSLTAYPTLSMTVVDPTCGGVAGSVIITAADGTECDMIMGSAGGEYCEADGDPVTNGTLAAYDMTFFAGTACEQVFSNPAVDVDCELCGCPMPLTYVDPMEEVCGPGNLPSALPTLADLIDIPVGGTLAWSPDPTDPATAPDATECGTTASTVYTGTVTCISDGTTITTVMYTVTDVCPIVDCGGPICDIEINSVPTETCDEATIVVADIAGTTFDPAYDTDIYLYQSDGTLIGDIGNLYTTGGVSLTWTPAVVGCDAAVLDYQVEIVCWPTAAPGLDGGLISIPFSLTVYPTLSMTVVSPTCEGEAGSVIITAADGTECDMIMGSAGGEYCEADGDPVTNATLAAYDMTFFAGTACEQVFSNPAVDIDCELCGCPMPLAYTDPMEEVCGPSNLPSALPILADLVNVPSGASLAWSPDPTDAATAPDATECGTTASTVYTGTVTCISDGTTITTVMYTVTDVCPIIDCGGPICDIEINSVPTEACGDATIVVADIAGTAFDPAYDTDIYLYQSDGTLIGDIGNLYTTGGVSLTWTPATVGCDAAILDYQVEIVCWPTAAPGLDGGLISIPFSLTAYPELSAVIVDAPACGIGGEVQIQSADGTVCATFTGTPAEGGCASPFVAATDGVLMYNQTFFAGTGCEQVFMDNIVTPGDGCIENCPLPIELASFTGKTMSKTNMLEWVTASEENTEWHIIERSKDGRSDWTEVGRTEAKGFSNELISYQLEDTKPMAKSYYRLRSVDFDGYEDLSNVIYLERKIEQFDIVKVYPVPTSKLLNIDFETVEDQQVQISLTDMLGKVITTRPVGAVAGMNTANLDMSNLASGIYFVTVNNGQDKITKRVVKN